MSRAQAVRAARRFDPGALRADGPGAALNCLMIAPFPEWVAVDLETGALLRAELASVERTITGPLEEIAATGPLAPVCLTLAPSSEPWDPSRPEGVALSECSPIDPPSRRAVRKLLVAVASAEDAQGVLGIVGPSISYADLAAVRRSAILILPEGGRLRVSFGERPVAHFRWSEREYALPIAPGAESWIDADMMPAPGNRGAHTAKRRGQRAPGRGVELSVPVLLTVGLDAPLGGQVRICVLGIVPAP